MTLDTQLRVEHLQLRPIVTIGPDEPLRTAAQVMHTHQIASLVVSEPAQPVEIVTERDLTRALATGLDPDAPVNAIASPSPVTVPVEATAIEAAKRMLLHDVRHLVVTRDERAIGVVSIRDLLRVLVDANTPQTIYAFIQQASHDLPDTWLG
jgi:CBS domain-containing protein